MKCPNCGREVKEIKQNGNTIFFEVTEKKTPPHYKIMTKHFCKSRKK
jgi:hypothetical protein